MHRHLLTSPFRTTALIAAGALLTTSAKGLSLSTTTDVPTDNVLFSVDSPGNNFQSTFATRFDGGLGVDEQPGSRMRGQSFLLDTDDNPSSPAASYDIATLSLLTWGTNAIPEGANLLVEVFEWPSSDPADLSGWAAGDGRFDGDTLDGTGMTAMFTETVALPAGNYDNPTLLQFNFDSNALTLEEDTAYGFSIQYTLDNPVPGSTELLQLAVTTVDEEEISGLLLQTTEIENRNSGTRDMVFYLQTVGTALPGDTDGDGDVDDADLGVAFSNYTGPLGPGAGTKTAADGDTDGDGDVDDADLGAAFAAYTGPTAAAVPEPTSLALLGLGGMLAARRRRA